MYNSEKERESNTGKLSIIITNNKKVNTSRYLPNNKGDDNGFYWIRKLHWFQITHNGLLYFIPLFIG
jgi:hypothetical protein